MGYLDGKLVVNPTMRQLYDESLLDLTVAGTRDAVLMVEAAAHELPEDVILEAIMTGHRAMQPIIDAQEKLQKLAGKPKQETTPPRRRRGAQEEAREAARQGARGRHFQPGQGQGRPRRLHPRPAQGGHRRVRRAGRRREGAGQTVRQPGKGPGPHQDPQGRQARRRPRPEGHPADLDRGRRPAPRPRLGAVHSRARPR